MKQSNLQISYGAWGMDYPDPENAYQLLYGTNKAPGPNESNFDHAGYNAFFEQMSAMDPGPKRAALIQRMEELVQEEAPWALGYYHTYYRVAHPWLLNFRGSEVITNKYKYFRVNRDVKRRYLESR
jgi:oligopeptide transport system substrate-binding protein